MVQRVLDWVFKREREKPEIPVCPMHGGPMQMRGVMGRPDPLQLPDRRDVHGHLLLSGSRMRRNSGSSAGDDANPVPGAAPRRPDYARRD